MSVSIVTPERAFLGGGNVFNATVINASQISVTNPAAGQYTVTLHDPSARIGSVLVEVFIAGSVTRSVSVVSETQNADSITVGVEVRSSADVLVNREFWIGFFNLEG